MNRTIEVRRRGVALLIVLVVLAIMTVTVGTLMYQTRMEINMTQAQLEATQAYFLARSGVWRALNLLREDLLKDMDAIRDSDLIRIDDKERGIQFDSYYEPWGSDVELLRDVKLGPPEERRDPRGSFSVRVIDEAGKLNINARRVPRRALERLMMQSGIEEEKAALAAAAIIDWRDSDDEVTLPEDIKMDLRDFGDQASEVTFFNPDIDPRELETSNSWLPMKNDVFDTVEELLLVPGIDYFMLAGEDANDNGELDPEERDGALNPPYDNEDNVLYLGVADYLTVHSYAKTNLNTAPFEVIEALLYEDLDEEAADAAERIVRLRDGRDRTLGTEDDVPFVQWEPSEGVTGKTVADIDLPPEALNNLKRVFDLRSDVFRVVSTGKVGRTERQISVVVSREYYDEEGLLDLYAYLFDELGEKTPEVDELEPKQREQVKFVFWEWDDYSLMDFKVQDH